MAFKLKKKIIGFLLVLSVVTTGLYSPLFSPRAEATGLPTIDVPEFLKTALDVVAQQIAQRMIDRMVQSSIEWAQGGFEGNPSFVTDLGQELKNIANDAAGNYINELAGSNLCSTIRPQIILALQHQYASRSAYDQISQCSFTGIKGNIEDFYEDFNAGGWQGWFSLTQNTSNNPYEAYLTARTGLDSAIATKVDIQEKKFDWGNGFKATGDCLARNPNQETLDRAKKYFDAGNPMKKGNYEGTILFPSGIRNTHISFFKGPDECIANGPDKTPGTIIESQLNEALGSGLGKLKVAEGFDQLISAFTTSLLNKYVFSSQGLLSRGSGGNATRDSIHLDNDGIPDGYDTDRDSIPDICLHGLVNDSEAASKDNCLHSSKVKSSPYFTPICQDTSDAIVELTSFSEFMKRNKFKKDLSKTWMDRVSRVQGSVERLASTITRNDITAYDKTLFAIGKYAKGIDKNFESLAKDGDLADGSTFGSLTLGLIGSRKKSDDDNARVLLSNTNKILTYLKSFQGQVVQRCDNPDTDAINNIPVPDIGDDDSAAVTDYPTDTGSTSGGTTGTGTGAGTTGSGTTGGTPGTETGGTSGGTSGIGGTATSTAAPVIYSFGSSVTTRGVPPGHNVILDWSTNLDFMTNPGTCSIGGIGTELFARGGGISVRPTQTTTYTLTCTNSLGTASKSQTILVGEVFGLNIRDMVVTLNASQTTISPGQSVTLSWTSQNVTSCDFNRPTSGSSVVNPTQTTTYQITCYNPDITDFGVTSWVKITVQ